MMAIQYRCKGGVAAWLIGDTISTDLEQLMQAIQTDVDVLLITDREAKFMGAFASGPRWEDLAKIKPKFTVDDLLSMKE